MKKILISIWTLLFSKKDIHRDKRLKIIAVINGIKGAVNSPLASAIVHAIPGRTDDAILECIRKWLPTILKGLDLADNGFNTSVAVRESVRRLKDIQRDNRAGYYRMIAGEMYACFTGLPLETAIREMEREYNGVH